MRHVTTFTDFLLESERNYPKATGSFTMLLIQLEHAAKVISSHVREAGLTDILGKTGKTNAFAEEVQKLDDFSNTLLVELLTSSNQTHALISEEMEEPLYTQKKHQGDYIVYFDPLDGSSNIDTNSPIGTIFSIYHKGSTLLQKGEKQVAAGYVMYGSSTMLVFADDQGVNGFTLDPAVGSFLLSHPNMQIPEEGHVYSINEAYTPLYEEPVKTYLTKVKGQPKTSLRYVGSMIADIHRTLLKGGIFLYPTDSKHKEGKLRLMLEVNPMSFILEKAGGTAVSGATTPLSITPSSIHQRAPVVLGSKKNVEFYKQLI